MNFSEQNLLDEAFGPELLRRYGLAKDSLTEAQYEALRQALQGFKVNKQGTLMRTLAGIVSREPQGQDQLINAVLGLAQLRQYGFDATGLISQATSTENLVQAARQQQEKFGKKNAAKEAEQFSVNDTEPDWTDGRYRVYVAHGENDCIRYGQNQRYGFCISRRNDNYYHDYRAKHNAAYYFVYDTQLSPYDKKHITVVAARQDGTFEFTFADNSQNSETRKLDNSLDAFLALKPGLEKARHLFVSKPLTNDEEETVAAARQVMAAKGVGYERLTPEQRLTYVRLGALLSNENYAISDDQVRDTYIARSHMLTNEQAAASTEAQRRRAAQLFWRYNKVDKRSPASWLEAYPLTEPATAAGQASQWPPASHAVDSWFGPKKSDPTPLFECACQGPDHSIDTAQGELSWHKLQDVTQGKEELNFPLAELVINAPEDENAPVIARLNEQYIALTGGARLLREWQLGKVETPVRFATEADIAYARRDNPSTLLEHALERRSGDLGGFANQVLTEANIPLPTPLMLAGGQVHTQRYFKRILREGYLLPQSDVDALDTATQHGYYQLASQQGVRVPLLTQLERMATLSRR